MKITNTIKNVMIIGVMLCFASGSQATEAYFAGLGDMPGGGFWSAAWGVSADGSVIVGYGLSTSDIEAFRWTQEEGMVGLGDLPGGKSFSVAYNVSGDGSVIVGGGRLTGSVFEAFRWTAAEGMDGLGGLPGGSFASYAYGVSGDGSVIVGCGSSASSNEKFNEAFRWTQEEGMVGLGSLPGGKSFSVAYNVSGDGSVIVGSASSTSRIQAFRWTQQEGMVGLGNLPGGSYYSVAMDVSVDGSIIVGESEGPGGPAAFIWDIEHGMRDLKDVLVNEFSLDLSGWKLVSAKGVSDDGKTIVGHSINPHGFREAWVARLPETATLLLDIKPGSCPNPINTNTRGKGKLPMAILGTDSFNVNDINLDSISIAGVAFPQKTPSIEDESAPVEDGDEYACQVGTDGINDLVVHFSRQEVIIALGLEAMEPGTVVPITVEGSLLDGTLFTATDCVTLGDRPSNTQKIKDSFVWIYSVPMSWVRQE